MDPLHPMLDVAVAAARCSAEIIASAASDPGSLLVREKPPNDFVTQADLASEQAIARTLLGAFPTHAMCGEESLHALGAPGADHVWIVDPLDGTTNFIHGYPAYAVSIALAVRGRIELGVVLDVSHGEVFHAVLGAFGAGVAVAATAVGGIPELVNDGVTGLLVPPGDPPRLAAALARLLDDTALRHRLAEAGREIVEREFTVAHMAERYRAVYEQALGQTSGINSPG